MFSNVLNIRKQGEKASDRGLLDIQVGGLLGVKGVDISLGGHQQHSSAEDSLLADGSEEDSPNRTLLDVGIHNGLLTTLASGASEVLHSGVAVPTERGKNGLEVTKTAVYQLDAGSVIGLGNIADVGLKVTEDLLVSKTGLGSIILPTTRVNDVKTTTEIGTVTTVATNIEQLEQGGMTKLVTAASQAARVAEVTQAGIDLVHGNTRDLTKKVVGIGVEVATTAILTSTGLGGALAVASAVSTLIAPNSEGGQEVGEEAASAILNKGLGLAANAVLAGTGVGGIISLAAPMIEPAKSKLIHAVVESGTGLMESTVANSGIYNIAEQGMKMGTQASMITTSVTTSALGTVTGAIAEMDETIVSSLVNSAVGGISTAVSVSKSGAAIIGEATSSGITIGLQIASTGVDFSADVTAGTISLAGTALGTIVEAAARISGATFDPVSSGLTALEGLSCAGVGLQTINGLVYGAVQKISEMTKQALQTNGTTRPTFFDPDGDGVVFVEDTVRGMRLLGLNSTIANILAYNIHLMFSYPTANGLLPSFGMSFPINIANMKTTRAGRKWGNFERIKWVVDFDIDNFFMGNLLKTGQRGFGILLLLFEWGTTWPFQIPSIPIHEIPFYDDIGLVVRKVILPTILTNFKQVGAIPNVMEASHP